MLDLSLTLIALILLLVLCVTTCITTVWEIVEYNRTRIMMRALDYILRSFDEHQDRHSFQIELNRKWEADILSRLLMSRGYSTEYLRTRRNKHVLEISNHGEPD